MIGDRDGTPLDSSSQRTLLLSNALRLSVDLRRMSFVLIGCTPAIFALEIGEPLCRPRDHEVVAMRHSLNSVPSKQHFRACCVTCDIRARPQPSSKFPIVDTPSVLHWQAHQHGLLLESRHGDTSLYTMRMCFQRFQRRSHRTQVLPVTMF